MSAEQSGPESTQKISKLRKEVIKKCENFQNGPSGRCMAQQHV